MWLNSAVRMHLDSPRRWNTTIQLGKEYYYYIEIDREKQNPKALESINGDRGFFDFVSSS